MANMLLERKCAENSCGGASVSALDHQPLCLNHFLERCYKRLEAVDPRGRYYRTTAATPTEMRAFIEECSRNALDVCLQCNGLTNLERGRLLDILIWAGELFLLLRAPRMALSKPAHFSGSEAGYRTSTA